MSKAPAARREAAGTLRQKARALRYVSNVLSPSVDRASPIAVRSSGVQARAQQPVIPTKACPRMLQSGAGIHTSRIHAHRKRPMQPPLARASHGRFRSLLSDGFPIIPAMSAPGVMVAKRGRVALAIDQIRLRTADATRQMVIRRVVVTVKYFARIHRYEGFESVETLWKGATPL